MKFYDHRSSMRFGYKEISFGKETDEFREELDNLRD